MSYQAIYRRWRPERFADILGQERIVTTLVNQIVTGRIPHAYLFCGSRGTGKTSTAKVLARAINCLSPVNGEPCGECVSCTQLARENNLDVAEIDAASNNGVDEIRDLREKVKYPPTIGRYKVYIIDEVHMLSIGAFNALLKTLEEPPAHAVFILATTEPQRLPATILSRCQRFDFKRIPAAVIVASLRGILDSMGVSAEDAALERIARAAEGGMRDAQSMLDMCLSYGETPLGDRLVREVLGASERGFLFDFASALIRLDAAAALRAIDELLREGRDPAVFAREVTSHLRALLLAHTCREALAELLEITSEDAARFAAQAAEASSEKLMRLMELFMQAENDMKWASQPRVTLELCAVRACHPEREVSLEAALERIDQLEQAIQAGVRLSAPTADPSVKEAKQAEVAPKPPKPKAPPPENDEQAFSQATKAFGKRNAGLAVIVRNMKLVGVSEDVAQVDFGAKNDVYWDLLCAPEKRQAYEACLSEAFGRPMHVALAAAAPKRQATPTGEGKANLEKAYEVFDREKIELLDDMDKEEQ